MNFIKRVFENKIDYHVHLQFQKFSRGEFKNRALIRAKSSGGKYSITTTQEFANDLVRIMAEKLGSNTTKITGAIISTEDLGSKISFDSKKQFMGIKQYGINREMSGKEILGLLDTFPKAFFALSFEAGGSTLKIKAKAPKSAKPSSKGESAPKPDFCKFITPDKEIAKSFVFEVDNFKEAEINHTFLINEIIIPEELKKSNDFARIREESKRKGKIIRMTVIDGREMKIEKEFMA